MSGEPGGSPTSSTGEVSRQPTESTERQLQGTRHGRIVPSKFGRRARPLITRAEDAEKKLGETTKERDEARENAGIDALTGIPNRRAFNENVNQLITDSVPFGFLIVDIDGFKLFNDLLGHQIGDQALVNLAKSLALTATGLDIIASVRSSSTTDDVRQPDSVFRWGGEEFAVLARGVNDIEILKKIAERIRKAVENDPNTVNIQGRDTRQPLTVSIGGTIFKGGGLKDFDDKCVSKADENLYFAKRDGKNRWVVS